MGFFYFYLKFWYQFIRAVKNVVLDRFSKKGFVLLKSFFIFLTKKLMSDKIFK